jgi:adenosylcobinamide kinase/adenosylcobinamide-phosphate guanylyltransferase
MASADLRVVRSELILGGQKSGKTARAESLAAAWLAQSAEHRAVYIATAQAWDDEMRERIARHRMDRAQRVPRMQTVEEPLALAHAIGAHSDPATLIVVDCLTLWLTARLMPAVDPAPAGASGDAGSAPEPAGAGTLAAAVVACAGPLVLVSNENGLGVIPLGRDVRTFVDALGTLNQAAAAACERVTLMSAGLPMLLKGQP